MSRRHDPAMKDRADQLASVARADPTHPAVAFLTQLAGRAAPAPAIAGGGLGIWVPKAGEAATFVRDPARIAEWRFWADVHEIAPKRAGRRVVLVGESVARGYLYDPHYRPAQVLESQLSRLTCGEGYEIVDLARTDLGLPELSALIPVALALEPDALVVFAGNNWLQSVYEQVGRMGENQAVELDDVSAAVRDANAALRAQLCAKVDRFLRLLAERSAEARLPVILVVPETNLGDWSYAGREPRVHWLRGEELARWWSLQATAESAWASGDLHAVAAAAERMLEIDGGFHPSAHEWLGRAAVRRDENAAARVHLAMARDACLLPGPPQKPRTFGFVRERMLAAREYGLCVVDLPHIFCARTGGVPDRRLFVDYCHLTPEGIRIAMGAAAQALIQLFERQDVPLEHAVALGGDPTPDVSARAHLFAAIHNAHYGQRDEIILHHLLASGASSKATAKLMLLYIDMAVRRAPAYLCRSFEQIVASGAVSQYHNGLSHPRGQKCCEWRLASMMAKALRASGIDARPQIESLLLKEHAVGVRCVNLLEAQYHVTDYGALPDPALALFRANTPLSRFLFVADASRPLSLGLTARAPHMFESAAPARALLNGRAIASFPCARVFCDLALELPAAALLSGVNELAVEWPLPGATRARVADDCIERGLPFAVSALYPVYGELARLQVGPA